MIGFFVPRHTDSATQGQTLVMKQEWEWTKKKEKGKNECRNGQKS